MENKIEVSKEQYEKFKNLWDNVTYDKYTLKVAQKQLDECGINYDASIVAKMHGHGGTVFADQLKANIRAMRMSTVHTGNRHNSNGTQIQSAKEYENKAFAEAWQKMQAEKSMKPLEQFFEANPKLMSNRVFGAISKGYSKFNVKLLEVLLYEQNLLNDAGNPYTVKIEKVVEASNITKAFDGTQKLSLKEALALVRQQYK